MLARLRDESRAMGQYGAAIGAEKNRGLVMGYYVERSERGKPGDFNHLSDDELLARREAFRAIDKASDAARLEIEEKNKTE